MSAPEFVRIERASGSPASPIVTVSYECLYCQRTASEGHRVDCPQVTP